MPEDDKQTEYKNKRTDLLEELKLMIQEDDVVIEGDFFDDLLLKLIMSLYNKYADYTDSKNVLKIRRNLNTGDIEKIILHVKSLVQTKNVTVHTCKESIKTKDADVEEHPIIDNTQKDEDDRDDDRVQGD